MTREIQARYASLLAIVLLFATLASARNVNTQTTSSPDSEVKGAGCLRAGVEHGCFILKDSKSGKEFNLHFKDGDVPPVDTFISFTGTRGGISTCQQGEVVQVTKWKKHNDKVCTQDKENKDAGQP